MYIPKNLYRIRQTFGGEFTTPEGEDYIGPVVETSNGFNFSGPDLNTITGEVIPVPVRDLNKIERPYNDYYGPTEQDYKVGFFTRYFVRDKRNGKFSELSRKQWYEKKKLSYVTSGNIVWFITGRINDGVINGIPYKGTSTRNRERLQLLETEFPGILNFFSDTSEFVK